MSPAPCCHAPAVSGWQQVVFSETAGSWPGRPGSLRDRDDDCRKPVRRGDGAAGTYIRAGRLYRQAGSTWRLIALAATAADRPALLLPAAGPGAAGAVRRLRPAVTVSA